MPIVYNEGGSDRRSTYTIRNEEDDRCYTLQATSPQSAVADLYQSLGADGRELRLTVFMRGQKCVIGQTYVMRKQTPL